MKRVRSIRRVEKKRKAKRENRVTPRKVIKHKSAWRPDWVGFDKKKTFFWRSTASERITICLPRNMPNIRRMQLWKNCESPNTAHYVDDVMKWRLKIRFYFATRCVFSLTFCVLNNFRFLSVFMPFCAFFTFLLYFKQIYLFVFAFFFLRNFSKKNRFWQKRTFLFRRIFSIFFNFQFFWLFLIFFFLHLAHWEPAQGHVLTSYEPGGVCVRRPKARRIPYMQCI